MSDVTSGTPPPAPGAPGTPPAPTPGDQGAPASWTAAFTPETRGYVEMKGWKDPSALVESYRNAEKLLRTSPDRILQLPGEDADPAAWDPIFDRLGRPKDPNGYELPFDEKTANEDDKAIAGWYREQAHKLGLTGKQAKAFYESAMSRNAEIAQKAEVQRSQVHDQQEKALRDEWKDSYKPNMAIAQRARVAFGISDAELDSLENSSLGVAGTLKLLHRLGSRVGEHGFVSGDPGAADGAGGYDTYSKERAAAELQVLQKDPEFVRQFRVKGSKAYEKAMALGRIANGGGL